MDENNDNQEKVINDFVKINVCKNLDSNGKLDLKSDELKEIDYNKLVASICDTYVEILDYLDKEFISDS
ncbi:MAG: hypothetical protein GF364_19430 [Candidatus Lokiarchaeota archaeon]|nr:hypothetical protein [Candidatus Lokiarchaeota archaeon]